MKKIDPYDHYAACLVTLSINPFTWMNLDSKNFKYCANKHSMFAIDDPPQKELYKIAVVDKL